MHRRQLLLSSLTPLMGSAKSKTVTWDRLSILTDEAARSPADAIAFARQYGLKWVELRGVPGGGGTYAYLPEDKVRAAAAELKGAGLRVSFLNTPMLKFGMPGSEPVMRRAETPEAKAKREERQKQLFDNRLADLAKAIRAAEIFDVRMIRVFTFSRVADPLGALPQVATVLDELGSVAKKAGMELLIENEASCNVATSPELAKIIELVKSPAIGINWDPVNEMHREGTPWPSGYDALPKKRVKNVQMKAEALILGKEILPWSSILERLAKDDYRGQVGLETHVFDGTLLEKAHLCMAKLREIIPA